MEKNINKSDLIGMFRRESLLQTDAIAIGTWDGIMELVTLIPYKHFRDYIDLITDCYDDSLNPIAGAPANTPEIIDAVPFSMSRRFRKVSGQ